MANGPQRHRKQTMRELVRAVVFMGGIFAALAIYAGAG